MKNLLFLSFMFIGLNLSAQFHKHITFTVENASSGGYSCSYTVTCHYQGSSQTYTIQPSSQYSFTFDLVPNQYTASFDASCANFSETNLDMTQLTVYWYNCYGTDPTQVTLCDPTVAVRHYHIWADLIVGKKHTTDNNFNKADFAHASEAKVINNINENNITLHSVNVYPNPTTGNINIEYDTPVDVLVYDISGKVVYNESNTNIINISSLNAGIYNFKITTDKEVIFEKIVLTK